MNDLLQQGITAYKAGKSEEARRMFLTVVRQDPMSDSAWGWMSNVCTTDQERIHCLKQVLRINPGNKKVRQHLDQLLSRQAGSELRPSPDLSTPAGTLRSDAKVRNAKPGFTAIQLLVLLGLGLTVFFIFGFGLLFLLSETDKAVIMPSPTSNVVSAGNNTALPTQVLPTATLIPTYAYVATWTPLPSPTSFVVDTLVPPSSKPQQAQDQPAPANPSSGNSSSSCSSQLTYAADMHRYYLDKIDYIHAPLINLYQSWIDEAARNRDAVGMVEAQRKLDNELAQVKAEKSAENQRYKAEQASINASCQ